MEAYDTVLWLVVIMRYCCLWRTSRGKRNSWGSKLIAFYEAQGTRYSSIYDPVKEKEIDESETVEYGENEGKQSGKKWTIIKWKGRIWNANGRRKYKKAKKGSFFITSVSVFSSSLLLPGELDVKELSKCYLIFACGFWIFGTAVGISSLTLLYRKQ